MFDVDFDRIIWCYALESSIPQIESIDEYVKGVPPMPENDTNEKRLYVLDDLASEADNEQISNLFTRNSHHLNLSVILLSQNLYQKGSHTRTISLNTKYLVVFKQPRDSSQIGYLARQIAQSNSKEIIRIYNEATKRPHGYLLIDFTQDCNELLRYRSDIFNKFHSGVVYSDLSLKDERTKSETFNGRQIYALYH